MIVRVVRMTFKPKEADRFVELFEDWRHKIIAMPGCVHLQLLRDVDEPHRFSTYSIWKDVASLEEYRRSDVFANVWPTVKVLFAERAEAWSSTLLYRMDGSTEAIQDQLDTK